MKKKLLIVMVVSILLFLSSAISFNMYGCYYCDGSECTRTLMGKGNCTEWHAPTYDICEAWGGDCRVHFHF